MRPISTADMPSIPDIPVKWGVDVTISSSASPTAARTPSKSPTPSSGPAPSMSLSSIPLRLSFPVPNSTAEMGDFPCGSPGAAHEPGAQETHGNIRRSRTCVIFINQIRLKLGVMFETRKTSGGNALKFYASMRLDIRRVASLKDRDEIIGMRARVKVGEEQARRPRSRQPSSTSCSTAAASVRKATPLTSERNSESLKKSGTMVLVRWFPPRPGPREVRVFLRDHQDVLDRIVGRIREHLKNADHPS